MTQEKRKKLSEAGIALVVFLVAFGIVVGVSFAFRELLSYFEKGSVASVSSAV